MAGVVCPVRSPTIPRRRPPAPLLIEGGESSRSDSCLRRSVEVSLLEHLSRQTEAHNIGADGERDELLAADRVGDRRGFDHFVGREMP